MQDSFNFNRFLFSFIVLFAAGCSTASCKENQWTKILLSQWTNRTIYEFKNIEYGVYFTDERKFLPSFDRISLENSIDGSSEVQEATTLLQPLHLSVYTTKNPHARLPVLVHIGDTSTFGHCNPGFLLEKDVILICVQYRTGAKGFLSMRNQQIPGNAAVLDILLALKWIQRNVANYGGDSDRVTLFGQYRAAGLIHVLTFSELGRGLFQQVILHSGSALMGNFTSKHPIKYSREVGSALSCNETKDKVKLTKCLTEASDADLEAAYKNVWNNHKGYLPIITIGSPSNVLADYPITIQRSGLFRIYPKLIGFVDQPSAYFFDYFDPAPEKSSFFTLERFSEDTSTMIKLAGKMFGPSPLESTIGNVSSIAQLKSAKPEDLKRTFNLVLTSILDWSNLYFKSAIYYAGFLNKTPKTYAYSFKYVGDRHYIPFRKGNLLNAAILKDEDRYLFSCKNDVLNEEDAKVAKLMVELWTSFAATGKPKSAENAVEWPEVKVGADEYMIIDDEVSVGRDYTNEFQSAVRTYLGEMDNLLMRKYDL